jgi:hypothetical protein
MMHLSPFSESRIWTAIPPAVTNLSIFNLKIDLWGKVINKMVSLRLNFFHKNTYKYKYT